MRETTLLLEQRFKDELREMEGFEGTEEAIQARYKTLSMLNDMLQEAYRTENEVEKMSIERQKVNQMEVLSRNEARRDIIFRSIGLGLQGAGIVTNSVFLGSMLKAEYKDDKIISSNTSRLLGQRLK